MKANKFKVQRQLIKISIAQTGSVKKKITGFNYLIADIKKTLHVVYKLHVNNKSILFIGPTNFAKSYLALTKGTKHSFVTAALFEGTSVKMPRSERHLPTKPKALRRIRLFDFIFLLEDGPRNDSIFEAAYSEKVPIIWVSYGYRPAPMGAVTYQIRGEFDEKKDLKVDDLIHSLIKTTIKKANAEKLRLQKLKVMQKLRKLRRIRMTQYNKNKKGRCNEKAKKMPLKRESSSSRTSRKPLNTRLRPPKLATHDSSNRASKGPSNKSL